MSEEPRVVLAAVAGAHGIAGDVRLKLFAQSVESLKRYGTLDVGGRRLTLVSVKPGGGGAIVRFAEVKDRTAAEALRSQTLSVPRSALPPLEEGEYYHADLLGLPCVSASGAALGTVVLIEDFGAGDIVEIERPTGGRFMVPVARAVTIEPDRLVIDDAFAEA
ncbi:MAG TPA: ribosome maturation factor RimM [Allosphingosinicella sp.]|jgi:16S rRNA processing protein RimM